MAASFLSHVSSWSARTMQGVRSTLIWTERLAWTLFFAFALLVLALRYVILPGVEDRRADVEAALSKASGLTVKIGSISAGWQGLHPDLDLREVSVYDKAGRRALTLPLVSVTLSWTSIAFAELRLHELEIADADLDIRRDRNGVFSIGGLEMKDDPQSGPVSDWILGQRRILIRDSRLRWNDEKRGAPELALSRVQLLAQNNGTRHRIALKATPPAQLASLLDIRADLYGQSLNDLKQWRGDIYTDLPSVDLAAWRAWVDYPADVRKGAGSLRAWLGFEGDRLARFTADVGLRNAEVRLGRDLEVMVLDDVSGRVGARELVTGGQGFGFLRFGDKKVTGFEVTGRQVRLTTKQGVRLAPADFTMRTTAPRAAGATPGAATVPGEIDLNANALDLEPIVKIVELLPLDAALRKVLADLDPRGVVNDFSIKWKGDFEKPVGYAVRGRFSNLSLNAYQKIPGFFNLTGSVDATEKGGSVYLASRDSAFLLPKVFEEAKLSLTSLDMQATWGWHTGQFEFKIDQLQFSNADAAGNATALYRAVPDTPGYLDLTGRLTRGDVAAVHRYMPVTLSKNLREWIKGAAEAGRSSDVRFRHKGNIYDFPFTDTKKGEFQVAVKLEEGRLFYADSWPRVENMKGDLVFERDGMSFRSAAGGEMFGAKFGKVDLVLPHFDVPVPKLSIAGVVTGQTPEFLRFIAASPVDRYIDGFTRSMQATGAGKLDLKLMLPLGDLAKTTVAGQYQLTNNQITIDADLPQLSHVNGVIAFTEKVVDFRGIRGDAVGGAFTMAGGTRADATLQVTAQGTYTVPGVGGWLQDPIFRSMSGGSSWRGSVTVNARGGEVVVESNLAGVAIDLPVPLGKRAADPMPLRFVKTPGAAVGEDEWNVSLGRVVTARVQRRADKEVMRVVRAAAGINEALPALPPTGLAVAASAPSIDVDDWRKRALETRPSGGADASVAGLPAPWQFQIRTERLTAYGNQLNQVRLNLVQEPASWAATLASAEANGSLAFRPASGNNQGRFLARMRNLTIPTHAAKADDTLLDRVAQEMPGVDVSVEEFQVGEKRLGKLEFVANNVAREWRIQKVSLANPDGTLTGTGAWRPAAAPGARRQIGLVFNLEVADAGKLLERLGFKDTVKAGAGKIEGNIGWDGAPLSIDYASLRGDIAINIEKGQFLKAEPGVGKLLGIMSLQALPRRLALDFRDVFSEGFAFDRVSASSKIERGILSTRDFRMTSVSAAVLMEGETDLARETQALKVTVLPDLSGGMTSVIGLITGAINPAGALIAYLAQRVLKDPISKAFSFEYAVTGNWADPQVARVQTLPAGQASELPKPPPPTPLAPSLAPAAPPVAPPAAPAATANRKEG